MIKNFEEVPSTIEGLRFYIDRGIKNIKEFKLKAGRLEKLVSVAKIRLINLENSPKKEEFDAIK